MTCPNIVLPTDTNAGPYRSLGGHMVLGPGDRRCRPQSTPRGFPLVGNPRRVRPRPHQVPTHGRPGGGSGDPPQTPRSSRPYGLHTFESPWTFKRGPPKSRWTLLRLFKRTRKASQKFGERSRVPLRRRPRRGRTSPPVGDRPHWAFYDGDQMIT